MRTKYIFVFSAVVAALLLPCAAHAQECQDCYGESFGTYDSNSNIISGYSRYTESYGDWYLSVESYVEDPSGNFDHLGGSQGYGEVEVDFSFIPAQSGSYAVWGYNYIQIESWWEYDTTSEQDVWVPSHPDPTPNITGVSPSSTWQAGTNVNFAVNGRGFGTNPALTIYWSDGTYYSTSCLGSSCDGEIDGSVSIPSDAAGMATVSVTSNGYNGMGFLGGSGDSTSSGYSLAIDPGPGGTDPTFMIVVTDATDTCAGCSSTVRRTVKYQAMIDSTHHAGYLAICEAVMETGWSCDQSEPTPSITSCSGMPGGTDANGNFSDVWSLYRDIYTPAGCGWITVDTWKSRHIDGSTVPFGTLTGYLHNNAIKINNSISPAKMPAGTRINP